MKYSKTAADDDDDDDDGQVSDVRDKIRQDRVQFTVHCNRGERASSSKQDAPRE